MPNDSCHRRPHSEGREERERVREDRHESREDREARRHRRRRGRKERVLHTRVSEQLSEDIRELAEGLRVPVSNLVRNVLEEAFSVVEEVGGDVGEILEDVLEGADAATERFRRYQARRRRPRGERTARPAPTEFAESEADVTAEAADTAPSEAADVAPVVEPGRPDFSGIVAWQPVILNAAQRCERTGAPIARGEEAFMGLDADGFAGVYLSKLGLEELHPS